MILSSINDFNEFFEGNKIGYDYCVIHENTMDPLYLSYSQANGVPQESKLATYMVSTLQTKRTRNFERSRWSSNIENCLFEEKKEIVI